MASKQYRRGKHIAVPEIWLADPPDLWSLIRSITYLITRVISEIPRLSHAAPEQHPCNAPTGGVRPDVGEGVRLLGKSTGSYGKPKTTRVSLVLRWMSKLGRCLTRQSKRSCSEATTEKAISDKPSTGLRTRGSTKEQRVEMTR